MYLRLPIFSLLAAVAAIVAAALVGPPAGAQVLAVRPAAVAPTAAPTAATGAARGPATALALDLQRSLTLRSPAPAAATTVHAAGSVLLLLADGIVADARIAPLAPPAPGFVYER